MGRASRGATTSPPDELSDMRGRLLDPITLGGLVPVLAGGYVLITRWGTIVAGHPSYIVFYAVAILIGIVASWSALSGRRRRGRRPVLSTLAAAGLVILGIGAWWLAPFTADEPALLALTRPVGMDVIESPTTIDLVPLAAEPASALTFYPGARVDARAYGRILAPIARAGHRVTIVKPPLGIALLARDAPQPGDGTRWVSGGHSLGGVAASAAAEEGASGLVLWASFPAGDISGSDLEVSSVFGTEDRIATPADIEASAGNLPEPTTFVAVVGGIHSYFGDYGLQPGDGEPGVDRETAQEEIVSATLELLETIDDR